MFPVLPPLSANVWSLKDPKVLVTVPQSHGAPKGPQEREVRVRGASTGSSADGGGTEWEFIALWV